MMTRNQIALSVKFTGKESCTVTNSVSTTTPFTLDRIFDIETSQEMIYEEVSKSTIDDVLKGYNGTIFAYGQSGSGKTFTMYGANLYDDTFKGIIPRAIDHIFQIINDEKNQDVKFEIKFSMLEIYKEGLYDLLNSETNHADIKIKEHPKKGIYVTNLSEEYISNQEELLMLIEHAEENRVVSETRLNKFSSRSHLLFQLVITQKFIDDTEKRGILNIVDLAGSEKVSKTHAVGETLEEAKKINLSLTSLGHVISALSSGNNEYIPYKDSKLTRILQDSLGGNYKTTLIVTCSPHVYNCEETISSLKFALRAKKIKNIVKINIKRSVEQLEAIIEELKKQLKFSNDEITRLKLSQSTFDLKGSCEFDHEEKGIERHDTVYPEIPISSEVITLKSFKDPEKDIIKEIEKTDQIERQHFLEKEKLFEEIDNLKTHNKQLQEELDTIVKHNNFDKYIRELEGMARNCINGLKDIKFDQENKLISQLQSENSQIRENYKSIESKYLTSLKEFSEKIIELDNSENVNLKLNNYENLKGVSTDFEDFIKNLQFTLDEKESQDLIHSYGNIYRESRMFLNDLVKEFIRKKDIFSNKLIPALHDRYTSANTTVQVATEKNTPHQTEKSPISEREKERNKEKDSKREKENNDKLDKVNLKKSFIRLNMLSVYYEKIIFDLFNKMLLDIKKFEIESRFKIDLDAKVSEFNKCLYYMLDMLRELKRMANRKSQVQEKEKETELNTDRTIEDEIEQMPLITLNSEELKIEGKKADKRAIIPEKRRTTTLASMSPVKQYRDHRESVSSRYVNRNIIKNVSKKSGLKNNLSMLVKGLFKMIGGNNEREGPPTLFGIPLIADADDKEDDNKKEIKKDDKKDKEDKKDKDEKKEKIIKKILTRKQTLSTNAMNFQQPILRMLLGENLQNEDDDPKLLRKELSYYKDIIENIRNEETTLRAVKTEYYTALFEFQEKQKRINAVEIENANKILQIYKSFFEEELKHSRVAIEELCMLIDEILIKYHIF